MAEAGSPLQTVVLSAVTAAFTAYLTYTFGQMKEEKALQRSKLEALGVLLRTWCDMASLTLDAFSAVTQGQSTYEARVKDLGDVPIQLVDAERNFDVIRGIYFPHLHASFLAFGELRVAFRSFRGRLEELRGGPEPRLPLSEELDKERMELVERVTLVHDLFLYTVVPTEIRRINNLGPKDVLGLGSSSAS